MGDAWARGQSNQLCHRLTKRLTGRHSTHPHQAALYFGRSEQPFCMSDSNERPEGHKGSRAWAEIAHSVRRRLASAVSAFSSTSQSTLRHRRQVLARMGSHSRKGYADPSDRARTYLTCVSSAAQEAPEGPREPRSSPRSTFGAECHSSSETRPFVTGLGDIVAVPLIGSGHDPQP